MEKTSNKQKPLISLREALGQSRYSRSSDLYNTYNIIPEDDEDQIKYSKKLKELFSGDVK